MYLATLNYLKCPNHREKEFSLECKNSLMKGNDVWSGTLVCTECKRSYPILAGVALVVPHVKEYIAVHVKGLSKFLKEEDLSPELRPHFREAKKNIQFEEFETDLESDRVNALYLRAHFSNNDSKSLFSIVAQKVDALSVVSSVVLELGSSVGGLVHQLRLNKDSFYLGVDFSFYSVYLSRQIAYYTESEPFLFEYSGDLLAAENEQIKINQPKVSHPSDFVVSDLEMPALRSRIADQVISLNVIDMFQDPISFFQLQRSLLREEGTLVQCSPYIWSKSASKKLRAAFPKVKNSSDLMRMLIEKKSFTLLSETEHLLWTFSKTSRQSESYLVHLIQAKLIKK